MIQDLYKRFQRPGVRDWMLLSVLCLSVYVLVLTTLKDNHILISHDTAWYLNRARLTWHGIFDHTYYNLFYPLVVGAFNNLIQDVFLAALLVQMLALYGITMGTYLLGRAFYSRRVAWLAALIITFNGALYYHARIIWSDILFIAIIVWCVLVYRWLITHPGTFQAVALGLVVAVAMYTRFEGGTYALLILLAAGTVYHNTGDRRLALRLGAIGTLIFGAGTVILFLNISQTSLIHSGAKTLSTLYILRFTPVRLDFLSTKWTVTLARTLAHWPLWAWLLVLPEVVWGKARANWLFMGLTIWNVLYIFVLSEWIAPRQMLHFLPFFALLLAVALLRLREWKLLGKLAIVLLVVLLVWPALWTLADYARTPLFAYRGWDIAQDGAAIDAWLAEQGLQDREIFTLCTSAIFFSRADFHLIARMTGGDFLDPAWWNWVGNLLPEMYEHDKLFMACDDFVAEYRFGDWVSYLEALESGEETPYPERLEEIGRVKDYIFYHVVRD